MVIKFLPFLLLALTFISLWIKRNSLVWGSLFGLSIVLAYVGKVINLEALFFIVVLFFLWFIYTKKKTLSWRIFFFVIIVLYSLTFKFHIVPGFKNLQLTSRLFLNFDSSLVGLLPLALIVSLCKKIDDWKQVFVKGLGFSLIGISIIAIPALISKVVSWNFQLPSHVNLRYLNNFFLVAIPEEGFYRGFIQNELKRFFEKLHGGKYFALLITTIVFTAEHIFWSPNLATFIFIFLAGLLYGYIYLITKRIESAIICHFLLNFIHMTFFNYHAI